MNDARQRRPGWLALPLRALDSARSKDPRWIQILFQAAFLVFVLALHGFALRPEQMLAVYVVAIGTQTAFLWALRLGVRKVGFLSPIASATSLCLLLRANSLWVPALAAFLAIASKFLIRSRGKHIFNPSLFGIIVVVLMTEDAWIATSQWGQGLLLAFFLAALGGTVTGRIGRADISLGFLGAHLLLRLGRVAILGHTFEVFLHQTLSGALILFAFFMISDPKSTPDARMGRIAFACIVALIAFVLRFSFFWNDAILWALFFASPLTPVLDLIWRRARFEWRPEGTTDEPVAPLPNELADAQPA